MGQKSEQYNEHSGYKQLKVRMKSDFKLIRRAVKKGSQLDVGLIRAFCSDALLMMEYQNKGDDCYPAFRECVERLATAAELGDRTRLTDAVAAVHRMKKRCHKRFK